MYNFIFRWQSLVGSLVGAAVPVSLWLLGEWYLGRKNHRSYLIRLEKFFVFNINNILDAKTTIQSFIDNQLSKTIASVKNNTSPTVYSADTAFFTFIALDFLDEGLFNFNSKSNYLENKLGKSYKLIKDFSAGIDDSRRQFSHTIEFHKDMAFQKLNPPNVHNNLYLKSLEDYTKMLKQQIMDNNIPVCLKHLFYGKAAVNTIIEIGYIRWKLKFSPSFRYFKNRQLLKEYQENTVDRIEEYLASKLAQQFEDIKKEYNISLE